jgi:peroxiredoxin family protein
MPHKKISIIVAKGGLDEIYPAFILASGARQSGIEANVFFTFFGLNAVHDEKVDHLHVNLAGNAANPIPTIVAGLPGMEAIAAKMMTKRMKDLDIPAPREMLKMLDESGVDMYACKLAMEMFGFAKDDLVPQIRSVLTVGEFYEVSDGGQVIFT